MSKSRPTVAVQIVGRAGVRIAALEARTTALGHAQSRLARLSAMPRLAAGTSTGTFADGYTWRMTVAPLAEIAGAATVSPHFVRIEVSQSQDGAGAVRLTTILLTAAEPQR